MISLPKLDSEETDSHVTLKRVDLEQFGSDDGRKLLSSVEGMSQESLGDMILQAAVKQNISSPNRLFALNNPSYFGAISIGFPELEVKLQLLCLSILRYEDCNLLPDDQ